MQKIFLCGNIVSNNIFTFNGGLYFMGIAEFVCIGIIVLFALIGLLRGFAKQIVTLCCWFFALIGAILLVEPVFKLVFAADNAPLHNVLSSFAGVMAFCDGFLGDMAAARGLASGGALAANWIIMLGILLILWILVTIVFKIVKLIFRPFTTIANPIKPVDKILGFLFGAVIGALHIFIFLTIAYLLKDKVAVVGEYLDKLKITDTSSYVYQYAYKWVADWIGAYFKGVGEFYWSTVIA